MEQKRRQDTVTAMPEIQMPDRRLAGGPKPEHAAELQRVLGLDRQGIAMLLLRTAGGELRVLELGNELREGTIGRHTRSTLRIDEDSEVSRNHAMLERLGSAWYVIDDGLSRNGTFVNGRRLGGRHLLVDGDVLRIGATLVGFRHNNTGRSASVTSLAANAITVDHLTPRQMMVLVALSRPYKDGGAFATPSTNQQIAEELFLSLDAVKTHMRGLSERFGVAGLPQNQKRARVVELAFQHGVISERQL